MTIGKNVWVDANVIILPGVRIDDGAIIGAGSVAVGHVSKGPIYGSLPAAKIGSRNMEHYEKLETVETYHSPRYFSVLK